MHSYEIGKKLVADEIVVRRIKAEDIPSVLRLFKAAFQHEISMVGLDSNRLLGFRKYRFLIGIFYRACDLLHVDYPTILVATIKDKVVGEVHLTPLGRRIWTIDSLAVDPDNTRYGIGRCLIKESEDYAIRKGAKKVLTSMRTDNVPAIRIAQKLGYEIYEKRVVLLCELDKLSSTGGSSNILTRKAKMGDAEQICEIAKKVDPVGTQIYETTPKDFTESATEKLIRKITGTQFTKYVAEQQGKFLGYASVAHTSPKEAARVEALYLPLTENTLAVASSLLSKMRNHLFTREVSKITAELSGARTETLDALARLGFTPIANTYGFICIGKSPR
jgi:L-amino acid N-acyltransferase YncA